MNEEELALQEAWNAVAARFQAAKPNRLTDPEEFAAARLAVAEIRSYWRGINDYLGLPRP